MVSFFQNEFTLFHWKDTDVERNMKVKEMTNSKIPSIFDHMVRNSSTIESNYQVGGPGGRVKEKRLPSPIRPVLSTQMRPSIASTSCLQM